MTDYTNLTLALICTGAFGLFLGLEMWVGAIIMIPCIFLDIWSFIMLEVSSKTEKTKK